MKKEQVKPGIVYAFTNMDGHTQFMRAASEPELFGRELAVWNDAGVGGYVFLKTMRPLTARERGHAIEELDDNALPPAAISCSDATAVEAARKDK